MAAWGDLSYQNRYGKKPQTGPQNFGDLSTVDRFGHPYGATATPAAPAPAAPPAASSSAASAGASGIPLDSVYQAQLAGLQRQRDDQIAQYEGQKPKVLASYGYTASGYDSSGAPTGLTFDPNNPFSQAALMKRTFDQHQAGTQNSMAAQGQLYSGALDQAHAKNEFGYQQGSDALVKAMIASLTGIAQNERATNTNYEVQAGQALGDSVNRAQQTVPAPPAELAPPAQAQARASGLVGGKYIDSLGRSHDTKTKNGKTYYLTTSGKWAVI